jgi:hypothetical protein
MRKALLGVVFLAALLALTGNGRAVPPLINYQGSLAAADGSAVNAAVAMTFAIYDAPVGGALIWWETKNEVTVAKGVFNVLLGSVSALSENIFAGDRYLSVTVGTETLSPRIRLASTAYALRATTAEAVVDGVVNSAALADAAVSAAKLDAGSVTTDKIADGSVIAKATIPRPQPSLCPKTAFTISTAPACLKTPYHRAMCGFT